MSNDLRTRERILALMLPLTAALYISAEGVDPKGTDQVITTTAIAFKVLPIAAKHPTQLYTSSSLTEFALGGVALSYAVIAMLIRQRGSRTATIAALIGGTGAFCGAIVNVFGGINLAAAATAHVTRVAAARFLITNFNSGPGRAFTDVYALGEFVAPVVMGIALWRSRSFPRWLAAVFVVGFELAEQTGSVGVTKVLLQMGLFAVAMVLLAAHMWRTADPVAPVESGAAATG